MDYEPALTPGQVAKIFNVSTRGIHTWIEKGLLQAWRTPGGHRRISRKSVEALLRQRDGEELPREEEDPLVVLIIDDDHRLLELYQRLITSWKLSIKLITAGSGVLGLIQAAKNRPDVLVIDPIMHDMDGFQMIRMLKKDPDLGSMRIITVTSHTPEEIDEHGGLPKGALHLQKPVPFARLESLLREQGCAEMGWPGK